MSRQVVLVNAGCEPIALHEEMRHEAVARSLADIKGAGFAGKYDPASAADSRFYFVPHYTVVGTDTANSIGIRTPDDLFGGVVPHWFLATKAVVHDVAGHQASKPPHWDGSFAQTVGPYVLPGLTAFDRSEAYEAGVRLLNDGRIRVKDAFAAGGLGQAVARDAVELRNHLSGENFGGGPEFAVVIELDLDDITTYSIGQICVDGITISYWGTQRTTRNNSGQVTYGGSDLTLVRGGFEAVLAIAPDEETACAVRAAQMFDAATMAHYPAVFASRKNYDVGYGRDARGVLRCGVIDQSWRIGGNSGVEVNALRIFKERPEVQVLRGSSFNVYGPNAVAPSNAIVHYQGVDGDSGPLLMYTVIEHP